MQPRILVFLLASSLPFAAPAEPPVEPPASGATLGGPSSAAAAEGDMLYSQPGQIAPAGDGARLNFYCQGSGSPTVVFDSGWGD